jgi:hypothetical protein
MVSLESSTAEVEPPRASIARNVLIEGSTAWLWEETINLTVWSLSPSTTGGQIDKSVSLSSGCPGESRCARDRDFLFRSDFLDAAPPVDDLFRFFDEEFEDVEHTTSISYSGGAGDVRVSSSS